MLVTRGLGRDGGAQRAILTTAGLGRQIVELGGKFLRRWRTRWRKRDLEQAPIRDRKEFVRRVQAAIEALHDSPSVAERGRAQKVKEGLLRADSARRQSLLRVDFKVLLLQFEQVSWVLDAYEAMLERRRRDDEAVVALLLSSL